MVVVVAIPVAMCGKLQPVMTQCRAWSLCDTADWQQCLVKHMAVQPGKGTEGKTVPTAPLPASLQAEANQTAADRVQAVNACVDALNKMKGSEGVPNVQCAFADGQHFTLYK